ncbi:hypothetical protein FRC10_002338 [Ceratobasidium sp. 414]|nr:hypothetical protein FRC10_002338 [Ceratobasidium sp. 414]
MLGEDVEMESANGSEWETQDSVWDEERKCYSVVTVSCDPSTSSSATSIGSSFDVQHRLLYRGALSVPNSAILLEGVQFVAHLPAVTPPLLAAPLPIALESMRGRPSLRLLGTMHLSPNTVRLDTEIDVRLYIHPQSYVTHQYFQNTLALSSHTTYIPERTLLRFPHPHPHIDPRITSTAVRIGLGEDEDVIVVYGRLQSEEYARAEKGEVGKMELVAARVVDPRSMSDSDDDEEEAGEEEARMVAVPSGPRPPRPDDPLPREPPLRTILKRTDSSVPVSTGPGSGLQRTASSSALKRTTSVLGIGTGKRSLAFGRVRSEVVVRGLGEPGIELDTPKPVKLTKPKDPASSARGKGGKTKGKTKAEETDDPFVEEGLDLGVLLPKMMARVKSAGTGASSGGEEVANKALIKRLAQSALETYGLDRDDNGFKEVFGYVTRGVGFAFVSCILVWAFILVLTIVQRNKMKSEKIGRDELRKMVVRYGLQEQFGASY